MLLAGFWTGVSRDNAMPEMTLLAALAGAAAGFLVFNFPPASIFMGDSGSLLFGFSLAALTLGHEGVRASRSDVLSVIAGPAFVLLIPIFDTTLVTVARLLSGRSPAKGGRDHSSHRLVAIGLSERNAVLVLWLLASVGGAIGLLLRNFSPDWSLPVGGVFLLGMCVFAVYLARVRVYEDLPPGQVTDGFTLLQSNFMNRRRVVEVLVDASLIGASYYWATGLVFRDPEGYLRNAEVFYQIAADRDDDAAGGVLRTGLYRGIWQPFARRRRPQGPRRRAGRHRRRADFPGRLLRLLRGVVEGRAAAGAARRAGVIVSRLIGRMFPTLRLTSAESSPLRLASARRPPPIATNTNISGCTVMV